MYDFGYTNLKATALYQLVHESKGFEQCSQNSSDIKVCEKIINFVQEHT